MSKSSNLISSEALGAAQKTTLEALLNTMIPSNENLALPGAGDELIVREVLSSVRTGSMASVINGLRELEEVSMQEHSVAFHNLNNTDQNAIFETFQRSHQSFIRTLGSIVLQCYYRDDRVMESLGMEPRAPFPKGFEVEQGDWSLLDPVKARGPIYKEVE